MGTVRVLNEARMLEIESTAIVSGLVDANGQLILYQRDGTPLDAGHVAGDDVVLTDRLRPTNNLGAGIDPDTLQETGWYSGYDWLGAMTGFGIATLQVIRYSNDWIAQIATGLGAVPTTRTRARYMGTTWSAWVENEHTGHTHTLDEIPAIALNVVNLDSYTAQGLYHQASNANAASGSNYPVPLAGLLEVFAASAMIYQRYTAYNGSGQYRRESYNGAWYTWKEVAVEHVGEVKSVATSYIPAGWLDCWGQAVSRATYAALYAAIGTTYGTGDGTTTFNVPNLKGRVVAGRDAAQAEFDVLGEVGGSKTHTLTANQSGLRDHRHEIRGATNATAGSYDDGFTRGSGSLDASFRTGLPKATSGTNGSNGWGSGSVSANAVESHNNLQPYITLNYIIKT